MANLTTAKLPDLKKTLWSLTIGLVVATLIVVSSVLVAANSFVNAAEALTDIPTGQLLSPSDDDAEKVESAFLRLEDSSIKLDRWMSPVRVTSTLFDWVPFVGGQLRGTVLLGEVARASSTAVMEIRTAGEPVADQLIQIRSGTGRTGLVEILNEGIVLDPSAVNRVMIATRTASDAMQELEQLNLVGPMDSAKNQASVRTRQVELLGTALVGLEDTVARISALNDDLNALSNQISGEAITSAEIATLSPVVQRTAKASAELEVDILELDVILAELGDTSVFDGLLSDAGQGVKAVRQISDGLVTVLDLANQASEKLAESDGGVLQENGAAAELLRVLKANSAEIDRASGDLSSGIALLNSPDISELVTSIFGGDSNISAKLKDLESAAQIMATAPDVFSYLLGVDRPANMLLLGQSADELRASGGFTSSIWVVKTAGGGVVGTQLIEAGKFDDLDSLGDRPPVPAPLARYMDAGAWYVRDVGWSPDFPKVASVVNTMFEAEGREKPDAVIAINQWAYVKLAETLGGLQTSFGLLQAEDVISTIERRTDSSGTSSLSLLWDGALDSITGESITERPIEILKLIRDLFESKDVMIWSADPAVQERLLASNWAGGVSPNRASSLVIVDSNVGWNKTDRNIRRSVELEVDLRVPEASRVQYTASYENVSESENDCSFQSRPTAEQSSYVNLKNSCYWNYFRTYLPLGATEIEWGDHFLPTGTIPERGGTMNVGSVTTGLDFDEDGLYLGGLLAIPPGGEDKIFVNYLLPEQAVGHTDEELSFSMNLWAQPGARGRGIDIRIILPSGYVPTSIPYGASFDQMTGVVSLSTSLIADEVVNLAAIRR